MALSATSFVGCANSLASARFAPSESTSSRTDLQLERAQSDGDKLATDAVATSGHAAATAAAATELRLMRLESEAQTDEIARLKAAAADAAAARAEAATHTDAVGQFLVQCMRDVKEKVVELQDGDGGEGGGTAAITVLPGAPRHTMASEGFSWMHRALAQRHGTHTRLEAPPI